MLREIKDEGLREESRTLAEILDALKEHETSQLSRIAASLAQTAEALSRVQERQERAAKRNMVLEEDLAREMGYVGEDGEVEKKQFAHDMTRCGVERHKTSRTRAFYFRDEVEAAVRRLGE